MASHALVWCGRRRSAGCVGLTERSLLSAPRSLKHRLLRQPEGQGATPGEPVVEVAQHVDGVVRGRGIGKPAGGEVALPDAEGR